MIFALLFAYFGYKKASDAGKNGFLWGFLAFITFIGTQLIVGLLIGVFIGLGVELWDWSENLFDTYDIPITIVAIVISFVTGFMVIKLAEKTPSQAISEPPPRFDGK